MSKDELWRLSKEELVGLIEAYAKLYTALDGLWFISVEEECGHELATKLDVKVWDSLAPREAKRISDAKKVADGIEAVIEVIKLRPSFLTKEYNIFREKNKVRIQVTKCRSLEAMERDKREVSSCLRVLENVYPKFVSNIDNRAKFRLLKAPPRKSAGDSCCEWEVEIP
jgi:hypothetical protein